MKWYANTMSSNTVELGLWVMRTKRNDVDVGVCTYNGELYVLCFTQHCTYVNWWEMYTLCGCVVLYCTVLVLYIKWWEEFVVQYSNWNEKYEK